MKSHLLGLDVGTSGTRAIILGKGDAIISSATREHQPIVSPRALGELPVKPATQTNAIEQPSPQIYWLSTAKLEIEVPQQALASSPNQPHGILDN